MTHLEPQENREIFIQELGMRMSRVDTFNTNILKDMLKGRGWIQDDIDGAGAASDAWLIAQHADREPDFQREVLGLIEEALDAPGVSKSNYAYLYDRVAGKDERPQRFGTQGRCVDKGRWEPLELEDADQVDQRRKDMGLGPLSEYIDKINRLCESSE